nr:thioredoxin domain-containing protein 3 [Microcebus murinus]XP_012633040.1 thioredoxin domain-containing protein 3 [Microcebus murinus]XP_012633041.1 thioredoxin domain-containing protein 3 [Microcebus murinus]XP_012633042.1 thioredoxin domain-containing protein 3 [Microcebus murinus]
MATKKKEAQLQILVNNQALWDEMLQSKGLTVIDVYQAWCGPCKAMQPLFRKLKNELNEEEMLHFAVAEADNIVTLQSFKDKCEPIFLFCLNGRIIAKVEGANAPLVNRIVTALIDEEKKIAAGEMVRPQYNEIALVDPEAEDTGDAQYEALHKPCCIAIIKPDAVLSRKALDIKEKITSAGFVIEAEAKLILTEDQVLEFYSSIADEPDFEEFMYFMTTALSYVLVLSKGSEQVPILDETETEPETEPEELSEDQPDGQVEVTPEVTGKRDSTLQEYLERQHISQFCDLEEDITNVTKFVDIFFPDFKTVKLQKTLALLRPDLLHDRKEEVLHVIEEEGFKILDQRQIILSEQEAHILCKEYENENYFERLIEYMTSGPSLAIVLLGDNGVEHWKELLGPITVEKAIENHPESLCLQFARGSLPINQLYGSDSVEAAEWEIKHFFPPQSTLALIKPHVTREQREEILKIIKEAGFELTQAKEMLLTEERANKIYAKITGKPFYKDVLEMLAEGPSLVMVLTKWNATAEWRHLMGPVDPEEAKLLSPDSIRARFGINILKNIVHGSSNVYDATEIIGKIFDEFVSENPEEN